MNKKKCFISIFFISFLLFILLSPIRIIGAIQATITSCVIFQAFTVIMLSRYYRIIKPWILFVAILFGSSIIDIPIRIRYFEYTTLSFPEFVGRIVSIIIGYLVFKLIAKFSCKMNNSSDIDFPK